jgi:hypothetical protein
VGQREGLSTTGTTWGLEAAAVASPGAKFTRKKAHERKLRPLRRAERM